MMGGYEVSFGDAHTPIADNILCCDRSIHTSFSEG